MPPHVDIPPPHVDLGHVDVPPPHIDVPPPHVDVPPPHVDVHVDVPPPHVDFGHVDIPTPHIDIPRPHIDIASPHIDIPSPHIDVATPHIDIPSPHIDIPSPHIDLSHTDVPPPAHIDVPPPPHADTAPAHVDVGYNHWWQNWPKTHGYIAARMLFPTSVDEIASQVKAAEAERVPLRAVGGGWSFSDASLPGDVATSLASQPATDRPDVQTADAIAEFLPLAQGFPGDDQPSIASIDADNGWLIGYDAQGVRLLGGARRHVPKLVDPKVLTPPQPQRGYLMNTLSLKSSLQVQLWDILSRKAQRATAPGPQQKHYFHVEAGITMEDLARLLDAQSPRLHLHASGGNRGATLAGALSTATHGAEFRVPLLCDRIKAIHLVGPGGQQWWIEGNDSIADIAKLQKVYPGLDEAHVIAGDQPIDDFLPQDWLNAVAVSMGCMGVIYSMVLEVFPLAGSQMVTTQSTWFKFLQTVQAQNRSLSTLTTQQLLAALRDPSNANHQALSNGIVEAITTNGAFGQGMIPADKNQHGEMAFNPNPALATSQSLAAGDCDCWVMYRQDVPMPLDSQPPGGGGMTGVVDAVFRELGKEFGIDGSPANLSAMVLRIARVYGISKPFHVDIPSPHIDIPSPHIDVPSPHIDIPSPHIDVPSPHIDVPSPHIDIPPPHIDVGHVDLHVDIANPFHIDVPSPHIDIPSPHIDIPSPHIDVAPPHIDVPSPHIDIPSPHIDIPSPHIDIGHVDLNPALEGLVRGLANPLAGLLTSLFSLSPTAQPILRELILGGFDLNALTAIITRIAGAHDTLDVALDAMTAPMSRAGATDLARPFLTGFLASTMGTANPPGVGVSIGTLVGAVGFPSSGVLGAGIEIGLPATTAFWFLQKHVLDKMVPDKPFYGYVSIRLCPPTSTLLGMQQFGPYSVMIEVVSFADDWGRTFIGQLQTDTLTYMAAGNDAMIHYGLENDQMTARHLGSVPALKALVKHGARRSVTKLEAFKLVRSLLFANKGLNPPRLFPAFNNSFTSRLKFE